MYAAGAPFKPELIASTVGISGRWLVGWVGVGTGWVGGQVGGDWSASFVGELRVAQGQPPPPGPRADRAAALGRGPWPPVEPQPHPPQPYPPGRPAGPLTPLAPLPCPCCCMHTGQQRSRRLAAAHPAAEGHPLCPGHCLGGTLPGAGGVRGVCCLGGARGWGWAGCAVVGAVGCWGLLGGCCVPWAWARSLFLMGWWPAWGAPRAPGPAPYCDGLDGSVRGAWWRSVMCSQVASGVVAAAGCGVRGWRRCCGRWPALLPLGGGWRFQLLLLLARPAAVAAWPEGELNLAPPLSCALPGVLTRAASSPLFPPSCLSPPPPFPLLTPAAPPTPPAPHTPTCAVHCAGIPPHPTHPRALSTVQGYPPTPETPTCAVHCAGIPLLPLVPHTHTPPHPRAVHCAGTPSPQRRPAWWPTWHWGGRATM